MLLNRISILNYKNIAQEDINFSSKMNCFIGRNGMGKTNLLDAVYYLSFCKSASNPIDSQNITHGQEFFVIQGEYCSESGEKEEIYCGLKRRTKKRFKRNKKEYDRLADHIGLIPLVMVSPTDSELILGGSDERRRFMDVVIAQYDRTYLEALMRYNRALAQRNTLLKEEELDEALVDVCEGMMAQAGEMVYRKRNEFIREFIPIFQDFYSHISADREAVNLHYESHAAEGPLLEQIRGSRPKDRILGFSLRGVHKDDLVMQLGDFPIRREGSQGQNKTYLIALKLAQFEFLKRTGSRTIPILLLDDVFDKLDADRVEQIVKLVASDRFGQIFMTDTNRDHLDDILRKVEGDYKVFDVVDGRILERNHLSSGKE